MATTKNEVKLELLLGCRVVDVNGADVGRVEEVIAEREGDELVVREYHVGTYGFAERLSIYHFGVGLLRLVGARARSAKPARIPWDKLDLSDPEKPKLTCAKDEL